MDMLSNFPANRPPNGTIIKRTVNDSFNDSAIGETYYRVVGTTADSIFTQQVNRLQVIDGKLVDPDEYGYSDTQFEILA